MSAASTDESALQSLTEFIVDMQFEARTTAFDVVPAGESAPIARMTGHGPTDLAAMQVLTGPDLDTLVGLVTPNGAVAADRSPVGVVNLNPGKVSDDEIDPLKGLLLKKVKHSPEHWRIVQPGLPPLTGRAVGVASRVGFGRFTRGITDLTGDEFRLASYLMPFHFVFKAKGSDGFSVQRPARKMQLSVSVRDSRIDRRLVLACVAAFNELSMDSVGKGMATLGAPFKRGPHYRRI